MIIKLAWKNIWRNKIRSIVMLTAITLGLIGGTFVVGFMYGWVNEKMNTVINIEQPHLQINSKAYIDQPDINNYFATDTLVARIKQLPHVKGISSRIITNVMIASAHKTGGIQVVGINPNDEQHVSALYTTIPDSLGSYFDNQKKNRIIIGKQLAETYHLKLNSKVVLTFVSSSGEQVSSLFRVGGIFNIQNPQFEDMRVFVHSNEIRELLTLPDHVAHELAIQLDDNSLRQLNTTKSEITSLIASDLEVRSWKDINILMSFYTDFLNIELMIIVAIILFALGFGIVNTVLMSVMERQRELSMLMAIGMDRKHIKQLIMTESIILTSFGGFIGIGLALLTIAITSTIGIDISSSMGSVQELGFPTVIHPVITLGQLFGISLLVVLTGIISAIYPAKKAVSINPAEGIRQ